MSNKSFDFFEQDYNFDYGNVKILLDHVHRSKFSPNQVFPLHAHSNYEFHYIASGSGKVRLYNNSIHEVSDCISTIMAQSLNNSTLCPLEYKVSFPGKTLENMAYKEFEVSAGDVFINYPEQLHWQSSSPDNPICEYSLRCTILLDNVDSRNTSEENEDLLKLLIKKNFFGVARDQYGLKKRYEDIFSESKLRLPGHRIRLKHKIKELIIAHSKNHENLHDLASKEHIPLVYRNRMKLINNYVIANINHKIELKELADNMNMSIRNLRRIIKRDTGISANTYIKLYRLKEAIRLIKFTEKRLATISFWTGYSSPYHLSREVKKFYGVSPSELRNSKETELYL